MIDEQIPMLVKNIIEKFIKLIVNDPTQELSYTRNESHAIITFRKSTLKNNDDLTSLSRMHLILYNYCIFI